MISSEYLLPYLSYCKLLQAMHGGESGRDTDGTTFVSGVYDPNVQPIALTVPVNAVVDRTAPTVVVTREFV